MIAALKGVQDVSDVLPRPSEEKPEYDENIKTLIAGGHVESS